MYKPNKESTPHFPWAGHPHAPSCWGKQMPPLQISLIAHSCPFFISLKQGVRVKRVQLIIVVNLPSELVHHQIITSFSPGEKKGISSNASNSISTVPWVFLPFSVSFSFVLASNVTNFIRRRLGLCTSTFHSELPPGPVKYLFLLSSACGACLHRDRNLL